MPELSYFDVVFPVFYPRMTNQSPLKKNVGGYDWHMNVGQQWNAKWENLSSNAKYNTIRQDAITNVSEVVFPGLP